MEETALRDFSADPLIDERTHTRNLAAQIPLNPPARIDAKKRATAWVELIRAGANDEPLVDSFLREFDLSNEEGVVLMRLSEALIRTPDGSTAALLVRDKILAGNWERHAISGNRSLLGLGIAGLRLSNAWIAATGGVEATNILARMGDEVLLAAMGRAMALIAENFVLGSTIEHAVERGSKAESSGTRHSYDMLGEAALTMEDADNFFDAYRAALHYLASQSGACTKTRDAPSLSVKLSALHPRYELAQADECRPLLVSRLLDLAQCARDAGLGLTLDAEEADRLELSLDIFNDLLDAPGFDDWDGMGIVIQAYQRRALAVIDHVHDLARAKRRQIGVRLVKGAYWDMEIKHAQELGLSSYPVFTRKEHSDISFLAGATKLLGARGRLFPQFATHNAMSAASIIEIAGDLQGFEFQRLHGMGEALHGLIAQETGVPSRVYAPVGAHKELLPYLVRRLLENGANSSFVNQLSDPEMPIEKIVADPVTVARRQEFSPHPAITDPCDLFDQTRMGASGADLAHKPVAKHLEVLSKAISQDATNALEPPAKSDTLIDITNPADPTEIVGHIEEVSPEALGNLINAIDPSSWTARPTGQRAQILMRVADLMEKRADALMLLCVREAGKTWDDALAELREAVDFCRYYAVEAHDPSNRDRAPLGTIACISPWNFPLAIFIGQIAASLAVGNAVVAKPAHQTPLIASQAVALFHEAGVPVSALRYVPGGRAVGEALVKHPGVDAVCFTGSTRAAQNIARSRAEIGKASAPLIAETGGINAMIVDSTALLEQAVQDTIDSSFKSAGQRCSACRIVCVQTDIADAFATMLKGAMAMLKIGDPKHLSTDLGPLIDLEAWERIAAYVEQAKKRYRVLGETPLPAGLDGYFLAPVAFEISGLSDVEGEIFGPVLHLVRYQAEYLDTLIEQINALGFGLTMGLHTRIDNRVENIAATARVGNLYVNRNQIGAVVGMHPFGGEGLSGTGPKAGGPNYLKRLSRPTHLESEDTVDAHVETQVAAPLSQSAHEQIAAANRQFLATSSAPISEPRQLPAPTGEDNTLSLFARGLLLCVANGDDLKPLPELMRKAITTGNLPILAKRDAVSAGIDAAGSGAVIVDAEALDIARYGAIDGALTPRMNVNALSTLMAERDGALLPVLSPNDEDYRFFIERTLTINTTAAGGNASLMSL